MKRDLFNNLRQIPLALLITCWSGLISLPGVLAEDVDLVVTGPRTVRIRISLNAEETAWTAHFQRARIRYHELLFQRLDANQDGQLDPREAFRTPPPVFRLPQSPFSQSNETHVAFNFLVLDDDGDGTATLHELQTFYARYEDGPVVVLNPPLRPNQNAPRTAGLFQRLDQNRDGLLDAQDIAAAPSIFRLDRDSDDLISLGELQPTTTASPPGEEFVASPRVGPVPTLPTVSVQRETSPTAAPDAHWRVRFVSGNAEEPAIELEAEATKTVSREGRHRVVLEQDGQRIELAVRPASWRLLSQTRQVLRREWASLPADKTLTADLQLPAFLQEHSPLMDANADQVLSPDELESYLADFLPARLEALGARVLFHVPPTATGLFAALDQDDDRHLSRGELSGLAARATSWDQNADQQLSRGEIPMVQRITVERETPPPPYLSAEQRNAGPPWFYRLDRNQDGTLTPAEFPGRAGLFDQLDRDKNRQISLEEAGQADRRSASPSPDKEN